MYQARYRTIGRIIKCGEVGEVGEVEDAISIAPKHEIVELALALALEKSQRQAL